MNYPTPPSGTNEQASFFKRITDCLKRSYPIAGNGLTYRETSKGVILSVINPNGDNSGGNGSLVQMFAITQFNDPASVFNRDWFYAKMWDGLNLGQEVKIAVPMRQRQSLVSELVDGILITFSAQVGMNNRIATDQFNNFENEVVYPRYVTLTDLSMDKPDELSSCQAVIFATKPYKGTGVVDENGAKVEWIEILPARVWAQPT